MFVLAAPRRGTFYGAKAPLHDEGAQGTDNGEDEY